MPQKRLPTAKPMALRNNSVRIPAAAAVMAQTLKRRLFSCQSSATNFEAEIEF
ncbi:hypothetical protein KSP39_PZI006698 [Platanthera zijinensis]|uniref:Uncharacterized protein n=1 Tax=Platanthera zijinensis TaxID=2320716 RepID=A0AAP0BR47_9ASPA